MYKGKSSKINFYFYFTTLPHSGSMMYLVNIVTHICKWAYIFNLAFIWHLRVTTAESLVIMIDRWSRMTCGYDWQVIKDDMWLWLTGDQGWHVVMIDRWSRMTCGYDWQVIKDDMWLWLTGDQGWHVVMIDRWSRMTCGYDWQVIKDDMWLWLTGDQGWHVVMIDRWSRMTCGYDSGLHQAFSQRCVTALL